MTAPKERKKRKHTIVIRGREEADLPAVAAIWTERSVVDGTVQLPYQSVSELTQRWSKVPDGMRVLVAERDGEVVGMGAVTRDAHERARFRGSLGMAVSERSRGAGVGGVLLDALLEVGERWLGLLRVELEVYVDNAPAIRLYRSRGFQVEGIARAHTLRDGVLVDTFYMARVSENLPWPRVRAEDAAQRLPPLLASGPSPSGNGHGHGKKR